MNPIGRYPQGLLGWLDSKASGTTPRDLHEQVQAGIDIGELYMLGTRQLVRVTSGNVTARGFWGGVIIPDDEAWFVHGVFSNVSGNPGVVPAGNTLQMSVAQNVKLAGTVRMESGAVPLLTAGMAAYSGVLVGRWYPPATGFYSLVIDYTGAGVFQMTTTVDCTPVKV